MNPDTSKRVVLLSMVALAALTTFEGGGLFKRVWGAGVVGVALSLLADVAPQVAGPFAALVVLGAATGPGQRTLTGLLSGASSAVGGVLPAGANVNPATNPAAAGPPAPSPRAGTQAAGSAASKATSIGGF